MKTTLMLLLCVISLTGLAQKNMPKGFVAGNFKAQDRAVIWEKQYSSDADFNSVATEIKLAGLIEKPEATDLAIFGAMVPFHVDYKLAGGSDMGTKPYITNMTYKAFATIKKVDGGYLVTIKKITTESDITVRELGLEQGASFAFETWAVNKSGQWLNSFKGKPAYTLDYYFNKLFAPIFK